MKQYVLKCQLKTKLMLKYLIHVINRIKLHNEFVTIRGGNE